MAVGHHTRIATKTCPIVVILTTNAAKVIGASENGGKQAQHNNEQPLLPFLTIFRTWAKREREKAREAKDEAIPDCVPSFFGNRCQSRHRTHRAGKDSTLL